MIPDEMNPAREPSPEAAGAETVPPEVETMLDEAVKVLYGPTFEKMVALFKESPTEFTTNIAIVINTVVDKVETDFGEMDLGAVAAVGGSLFQMLLTDLVEGGIVEEPTKEMIIEGMQATLSMWVQQNQDRLDPNEVGQSLQDLQVALQEEGVLGPEQPAQAPGGPQEGMV